jgi:succinyl-CoA synthetase beta subunit
MLLIESDGKALFQGAGIRVPAGVVVAARAAVPALTGTGPWIVKAQVPVGGRGRAGGVVRCDDVAAVRAAVQRLNGSRIKGHEVQSCLIETAVSGSDEYYLSLMLDPANYGVRAALLREGGVDVERAADAAQSFRLCDPEPEAIAAALRALSVREPQPRQAAIADVGGRLARLLFGRELMLAEINPLFFDAQGAIAGDAKVVIDLNAVERQDELAAMIERGAAVYPDAFRKLHDGFDYVEVDPDGEIGLVTTGAGLSWMRIDELTARGGKPLNFCDIRTGQLRGDPTRLINVFQWIAAGRNVRSVLINFFAGITHLGEVAKLLVIALNAVPELRVPVTARLIGNGYDEAIAVFAAAGNPLRVEPDLDRAIELALAPLTGAQR